MKKRKKEKNKQTGGVGNFEHKFCWSLNMGDNLNNKNLIVWTGLGQGQARARQCRARQAGTPNPNFGHEWRIDRTDRPTY